METPTFSLSSSQTDKAGDDFSDTNRRSLEPHTPSLLSSSTDGAGGELSDTNRRSLKSLTPSLLSFPTDRAGEDFLDTNRSNSEPPTPLALSSQTDNPPPPPPVERYVRADGKIGVIISPDHGGAWSSQDRDLLDPEMTAEQRLKREEIALFDKDIVELVLAHQVVQAKELFKAKIESVGDFCTAGMDLQVEWVKPGEEFEVAEYDGLESIRFRRQVHFWRA